MADKLVYFNCRYRAEPVRMLYALAGKELDDERIKIADWPSRKAEMPNGEVPILKTSEGCLNQSTTIGRYVAKKLGLMGSCLWEEALHDMVVENINELMADMHKVYGYMLFGEPKPDNVEDFEAKVLDKIKQRVQFVQVLAECRKKENIVCDQIGLADVWVYCILECFKHAFPDVMQVTEWTKCFTEKMEACEKVKKYLQSRPVPEAPI